MPFALYKKTFIDLLFVRLGVGRDVHEFYDLCLKVRGQLKGVGLLQLYGN